MNLYFYHFSNLFCELINGHNINTSAQMKVLELIEPLKVTVFKIHVVNLMIKYLQFYNYDRTKHLPYSVKV